MKNSFQQGTMRVGKFNFYKQQEAKDCGPTCLQMIAKYYGKSISLVKIRRLSETTREGSSLSGISDAAEKIGFRTLGVSIDYKKISKEAPLPLIVHWQGNHFVVVYKITKKKVFVADPACGFLVYSPKDFIERWVGANATENTQEGVALLLEPTPVFYQQSENNEERKSYGWEFLSTYVLQYQRFFAQLILGLVAVSVLQLLFPFLTQSIVDIGIKNQDIGFIYISFWQLNYFFFWGVLV